DVADARHLEDVARGAAGDHASTRCGRLEQDAAGAALADDGMDNRATGKGHVEEVLARLFDSLLDREAGLLRLAVTKADLAVAVAHDHERGKREAPATLHDLCHAVHLDGALFVLCLGHAQNSSPSARAASARTATRPWYTKPPRSKTALVIPAALARVPSKRPTDSAPLTLPPPLLPKDARRSGSTDEAAARVRPAVSSMSWAEICRLERWTASRGHSAVPLTLMRTRAWRRSRRRVRSVVRAITSPPFQLCASPVHWRSARPCPCKAQVCVACECRPRPVPPFP